jgi:hypothetical protein
LPDYKSRSLVKITAKVDLCTCVYLKLSYLIVIKREVYRDVPLEGDGHCHEDGTSDGRLVQRVQEVGEQQDVDVRLKLSEKSRSRLM